MKTREAVIDGICKELRTRRGELADGPVPSVYFGGGTPSLLTEAELGRIFEVLFDEGYLSPPTSVTPPTPDYKTTRPQDHTSVTPPTPDYKATRPQDHTSVTPPTPDYKTTRPQDHKTNKGGDAGTRRGQRQAGRSSDASDDLTQSGGSSSDVSSAAETSDELLAGFASPKDASDNRPEITLEANPDDLDEATIQLLATSPVNRLSIGIQSFFEEDLRFMNRAHSAGEARAAVEKVNRAGFHDVSIDLIYGGQTTTDKMWAENLRIATDLGVNHLSAYALTVEPKTALGVNVAKGKVPDTDDAKFDRHFNMLVDHLTAAGYRHYEISNFCLPGHESRHNSGYWSGQPYLGIGPGAHGFDGDHTRRWNVSNNPAYAKAWAEITSAADFAAADGFLYEEEVLTDTDRYNEYIMTGLRRDIGVSVADLTRLFGEEKARYFVQSQVENLAEGLFVDVSEGTYRLSRAGLMRADGVAGDGFWV